MPINAKVFDDKNHSCYYDNDDGLFSNKFITLRRLSNNNCVSSSTGINGEDAVFSLTETGDYIIYETLLDINGTYDDSYFDNLRAEQPAGGYTSTTPRKYKITVSDTNASINKEFGHASYEPIPFSEIGYISSYTSSYSNTELYTMNIKSGDIALIATYLNTPLNAIGCNLTDGTIIALRYATSSNIVGKLYRIIGGDPLKCYELKEIYDAVSYNKITLKGYHTGTVDIYGNYYFRYIGETTIRIINVNPFSLNFLSFKTKEMSNLLTIYDWSTNSNENALYTFDSITKIIAKICLDELSNDGKCIVHYIDTDISIFGDAAIPPMIGVCTTDNGMIYLLSSDGKIYKANLRVQKPKLELFSELSPKPENAGDSANISLYNIEENFIDYGNAAEEGSIGTASYKTKLTNNGPSHFMTDSIYLGNKVLPTDDAVLGATNEDNDCTKYPLQVMKRAADEYSLSVSCYNNTGKTAKLCGWLDFNTDGIFSVDEAFVCDIEDGGFTAVNMYFKRPEGAFPTKANTYIRLRLTTDEYFNTVTMPEDSSMEDPRSIGTTYTLTDGEVEDYLLTISNLYCEKKVDKDIAVAGEKLTYTISITNYGETLDDIKVIDNLDINHLVFNECYYVLSSAPDNKIYVSENDLITDGVLISLDSLESATFTLIATVKICNE